VTLLDVNSLQPKLQVIINSFTSSSPAQHKMLVTAFKACQLESGTPSRSGPIAEQAVLIPAPNDAHETKRLRSDSVDLFSFSLTKKLRFLKPDSKPFNKGHSLDLILTADKLNLAEPSTIVGKVKSK
jgi:hypothetical protein